jgi:hypothetical protein
VTGIKKQVLSITFLLSQQHYQYLVYHSSNCVALFNGILLTLIKNFIVFEVDLDMVLLELILEFEGEMAVAAPVGHHLVLDPLVVDEGGALRERLPTHVAFKGTQPLVHVHVAT